MGQVREHWSSRFGFFMAAIGSAIGLGILWKFPFTIGENGGGIFLITYVLCLVVVGLPLFMGELVLGRASQRASVGAYAALDKKEGSWKFVGWFGALSSFLIMSFYSVIAGFGMSYILMSLSGIYHELSSQAVAEKFALLSSSGPIAIFWHFLFTAITMGIVLGGVRKGIERWAKVMTRALLLLLVLLFLYSTTLSGFSKAASFIFIPDSHNFRFSSALEALGLAFWTLSIGQGIMISYGSYMRKSEPIPIMALVVALAVIVASLLAAMIVFPVVFTFHLPPQSGYGLVFQTLPYLFAKLPGALLISTLFFTLFVFTALTSAIPLIEVVATNFMELYGLSRKRAVLGVSAAAFLFGIPSACSESGGVFSTWKAIYGMNFLATIDRLVSTWIIPVGGVLSALFIGWVMHRKQCQEEWLQGVRYRHIFWYWYFFIRYVVPLTIFLIILQKSGLIDFDAILR